jgi:hypothetical protein
VPFAIGTRWLDESYDDQFGVMDSQTIGAGFVTFGVEVDSVLSSPAGPKHPPDDATIDPGNWGKVQSVHIATEDANH